MSYEKLIEYSQQANLVDLLDEDKITSIVENAIKGYEDDRESMKDFLDDATRVMDLVQLKSQVKNTPFMGAANIKYPLITTAVIQFASRTLPEVIREDKAVRAKVIGYDPDESKFNKGDRTTKFINFKLLEESDTWLEETDRLFHHVCCIGTVFKKSYYDPIKRRVTSKLVPYDQIIVNRNIKSLEDAPRISHVIDMSINDVISGIRAGYYSDIDLEELQHMEDQVVNESNGFTNPEFIEQHTWLDLDEDGYKEPYMVLFHPDSKKILRIRANYVPGDILSNQKGEILEVKSQKFFTDFHFIPNPDGSFFSIGFGGLLLSTNATVNTLFNNLINSGTLANHQGGFIGKGVRTKKQNLRLELGEWIQAESATGRALKDEIVPLPYKEPSTVLLQLLMYLIEGAKAMTSNTDALTGTADTQNASPQVVLSLIQQGLKVFNMIQQRMNRGLKKEYKILFNLYHLHTGIQEYLQVLDLPIQSEEELLQLVDQETGLLLDFDPSSFDVTPVADFNSGTDTEKMMQNQAILNMLQYAGGVFNIRELVRRSLVVMKVEQPDTLLKSQEELQQESQSNPMLLKQQAEMHVQQAELELQQKKLELEWFKAEPKAILDIATAESKEAGVQIQQYQQYLNALETKRQQALQMMQQMQERQANAEQQLEQDQQGAADPMVGPPGDPGLV